MSTEQYKKQLEDDKLKIEGNIKLLRDKLSAVPPTKGLQKHLYQMQIRDEELWKEYNNVYYIHLLVHEENRQLKIEVDKIKKRMSRLEKLSQKSSPPPILIFCYICFMTGLLYLFYL